MEDVILFCFIMYYFRSNPHLSDSELEITIVRCLNVPLQQGKWLNSTTFIDFIAQPLFMGQ